MCKYLHKKLLGELYTEGHSLHVAFEFRWIIMPTELYSAQTFPAKYTTCERRGYFIQMFYLSYASFLLKYFAMYAIQRSMDTL